MCGRLCGKGAEPLPEVDAEQAVKYLGCKTDLYVQGDGELVEQLRAEMKTVGALLERAKVPAAGKREVALMCGRSKCLYPLRVVSVEEESVRRVEQPIKAALKHSCGLPVTFPDGVWHGSKEAGMVGELSWYDRLMAEKVQLLLLGLGGRKWEGCRGVVEVWRRRLAEAAGSRAGVLRGQGLGVHRVYAGTWMGQVVRWMREQGVEVWGERGMEGHMEGDVLLCELVRTAERRQEVLDACVLADVHWVGQVVREVGGTWLVDEVAAAKLRGVPGGGQVWSMLQRPLGVSGRQGRQSCGRRMVVGGQWGLVPRD